MDATRNQIDRLLRYDPDTGVFTWRSGRSAGQQAGHVSRTGRERGRVLIGVFRKLHKAHRLAWLLMTGEWPTSEIDHRDGNPSNNAWSNLRLATPSQNQENRRSARRDSTTGLLGVTPHPRTGTFRASIQVKGRRRSLGYYPTPEAAHAAYVDAKRSLHTFNTL